MRLFLLLLIFSIAACKYRDEKVRSNLNTHDKNLQLFDSLIQNCDQVRILFLLYPEPFPGKSPEVVATDLRNSSQILRLRDFVFPKRINDTCGRIVGTLSFIKGGQKIKSIDFNTELKCASFYLEENSKYIKYKMTEEGRSYLSKIHDSIFQKIKQP